MNKKIIKKKHDEDQNNNLTLRKNKIASDQRQKTKKHRTKTKPREETPQNNLHLRPHTDPSLPSAATDFLPFLTFPNAGSQLAVGK